MLPLKIQDAPVLARLYALSFPRGWSEAEISDLVNLQGFFGFRARDNSGMIMCNLAADEAEIYTICVAPEQRGQGIGTRLLSAALSKAKELGARTMFLEVAEDNSSALGLYTAAGFTQIGCRKAYYQNKINALVLAKEL